SVRALNPNGPHISADGRGIPYGRKGAAILAPIINSNHTLRMIHHITVPFHVTGGDITFTDHSYPVANKKKALKLPVWSLHPAPVGDSCFQRQGRVALLFLCYDSCKQQVRAIRKARN